MKDNPRGHGSGPREPVLSDGCKEALVKIAGIALVGYFARLGVCALWATGENEDLTRFRDRHAAALQARPGRAVELQTYLEGLHRHPRTLGRADIDRLNQWLLDFHKQGTELHDMRKSLKSGYYGTGWTSWGRWRRDFCKTFGDQLAKGTREDESLAAMEERRYQDEKASLDKFRKTGENSGEHWGLQSGIPKPSKKDDEGSKEYEGMGRKAGAGKRMNDDHEKIRTEHEQIKAEHEARKTEQKTAEKSDAKGGSTDTAKVDRIVGN